MTHRYFPGLNALRFYAALSVVFAHLTVSFIPMRPWGVPEMPFRWLFLSGWDSVNLFLVLSGFLIGYLLLNEVRATRTTDLKRFWIRRSLRIWPLYYAVALPAVLILPSLALAAQNAAPLTPVGGLLILLLQPHWLTTTYLGPFAHLWSLGLEETFYIVFPFLIRRPRHVLNVAFAILVLRYALEIVAHTTGFPAFGDLLFVLRFECILVGVLGAYVYVYSPGVTQVLYRLWVQRGGWGLFALIVVFGTEVQSVTYNLASGVVFLIVILNVATNADAIVRLKHPALEELGKLSYALYMWHYPALFVAVVLIHWIPDPGVYSVLLYGLTVGLTFVAAYLSHRFLETPFLRLKDRARRRRLTVAAAGD